MENVVGAFGLWYLDTEQPGNEEGDGNVDGRVNRVGPPSLLLFGPIPEILRLEWIPPRLIILIGKTDG